MADDRQGRSKVKALYMGYKYCVCRGKAPNKYQGLQIGADHVLIENAATFYTCLYIKHETYSFALVTITAL